MADDFDAPDDLDAGVVAAGAGADDVEDESDSDPEPDPDPDPDPEPESEPLSDDPPAPASVLAGTVDSATLEEPPDRLSVL